MYTDGKVTYTPDNNDKGVDKWFITVALNDEGEAQAIAEILAERPGYKTVLTKGEGGYPTSFKIVLYIGEIK